MIRSKLTIVPLVAASAMALASCKPPTPTAPAPAEAAAPAAQPEVKQVTSAPAEVKAPTDASATPAVATPPAADATTADADEKPAADSKPIVLPEVVATVNGQNITSQQLEEIFKAAVEGSGSKAADLTNEQKLQLPAAHELPPAPISTQLSLVSAKVLNAGAANTAERI